jgi:hypothetical protein
MQRHAVAGDRQPLAALQALASSSMMAGSSSLTWISAVGGAGLAQQAVELLGVRCAPARSW